jgi:SAM-dependent methyltransferase
VDEKTEELTAVIQEIRDRVRSRHPNGNVLGDVPLANLIPLVHARDAAEGKVASIGTLNPRPPGLKNSIVQWLKGLVARALDWHVREQVEFNRAVMNCVQATMESLNETNRAISLLAGKLEQNSIEFRQEARELKDIRAHWAQWRPEWERRLVANEAHFLRSVSELQAAWQHRVTLLDETHREQMKALHVNFQAALDRSATEIQQRLWVDLDRIRSEYEGIIHAELRLLRQKTSLLQPTGIGVAARSAPAPAFTDIDWLKFAEKFRGSEQYVKEHQRMYADRFAGASDVLDMGCGRGELLEVLRERGINAHGIDLNDDSLALCRSKGLEVEKADMFEYLPQLPDESLGGAVCAQVAEHLPPERLPELVRLIHSKLKRGALLAMETPNPECLAIFATHFYLDPTHTRPIPPALMAFYLEEAGLGRLETVRLYPAVATMPSLEALPEEFRKQFFGSLDYVVFGRKL